MANMQQFLQKFDVLACPTVGLFPGPAEEEYPYCPDQAKAQAQDDNRSKWRLRDCRADQLGTLPNLEN